MSLAPSEQKMRKKLLSNNHVKEINEKKNTYTWVFGGREILRSMGHEKLPVLARALQNPKYMDVNHFYQRRLCWDKTKQSRLIESFLINFPVPPITLYQKSHKSYTVLDGKQRMIAIRDFYEDKLELTGLEFHPELNGLTYYNLPGEIKQIISVHSIDSITILTKQLKTEELFQLQRSVFGRLNKTSTGEPWTDQEFRSYVYSGKFNNLLIELANNSIFTSSWEIPIDEPENLAQNKLYQTMEDAELILNFFALRNLQNYQGELRDFLDIYMLNSMNFTDDDIRFLKDIFLKTIKLAHDIYKNNLFRPFDVKLNDWAEKADKACYSAVMVGLSRHLHSSDILVERQLNIIEETKKMFEKDEFGLLTSNTNTTTDIQSRKIQLFDDMLSRVIAG